MRDDRLKLLAFLLLGLLTVVALQCDRRDAERSAGFLPVQTRIAASR